MTRILPEVAPPLPEDVADAAQLAASMGNRYESCEYEKLSVIPQVIRVKRGSATGKWEIYAFPEFNEQTKASANKMIGALIPHSKAVVFLHEIWFNEHVKEIIEGSGTFMPPRVDPQHSEAVAIRVFFPDGRMIGYINRIAGELPNKHLTEWKLYFDTAKGDKAKSVSFEPSKPVPLLSHRVRP